MGWDFPRKPGMWVPGLNREHPLSRGLRVAVPMIEPGPAGRYRPFDYAGRVRAGEGDRTREIGRLGAGSGDPGSGTPRIRIGFRSEYEVPTLTVAVLVRNSPEAAGAYQNIAARGTVASPTPWAMMRFRLTAGMQWLYWKFAYHEDGEPRQASVPLAYDADIGEPVLFVGRIDSDQRSVDCWVFSDTDGILQAMLPSEDWRGDPLDSSTAPIDIGFYTDANYAQWGDLIYGFWLWDRWVPDAEIRRFARDPWEIFRRPHCGDLLQMSHMPWQRRRLWGSDELYAAPAGMRPAGSRSTAVSA